MKEEDPQVWNHLPITSTSEIIYNWKRQAAGGDSQSCPGKGDDDPDPSLSLSLPIPHTALMGFS